MSYFDIAFLLATGVVALAGWGSSLRRRRGEVIGSELVDQPDEIRPISSRNLNG